MKSKRTSVVATALAVAIVGGGFAVAREIQNSVSPPQRMRMKRVPRRALPCRLLPIWLSASRLRWSTSR